jgi:hypothetical protein
MAFTELELWKIEQDFKGGKKISENLKSQIKERYSLLNAINDKFDLRYINKYAVQEFLALSIVLKALKNKPTQFCKDCINLKNSNLSSKKCGECFFYENNQQSNFKQK